MIVALIGPLGGPGVSTSAGGLTSALGQTAMVALVDFDLRAPSLALAFDLNPALNLYMVLHETNGSDDPRIWADALAAELQPLDEESPGARVLVGAPSVGLASAVEPDSVRDLLVHLAAQEQFVVVDLGAECDAHTVPGAAQHAVLELADRILVVSRADVLGLGRTRALLDRLRGVVSRPDERLALVLNRHQPRHHHDDIEVARAFRTSVAAVIPDDPAGVQAALAAQRPLGALGRGRRAPAARALFRLAREISNAGRQPMSAAPARRGEHWSLSALLAFGRHIPRRSHA
jgi:Flp pilus assembly CpaE family ATPase